MDDDRYHGSYPGGYENGPVGLTVSAFDFDPSPHSRTDYVSSGLASAAETPQTRRRFYMLLGAAVAAAIIDWLARL